MTTGRDQGRVRRVRLPGLLLGLVAVILGIGLATAHGYRADGARAAISQGCEARSEMPLRPDSARPEELFDLPPRRFLEHGGILRLGRDWVVSGEHRDGGGWGGTQSQEEVGVPLVYQTSKGLFDLPLVPLAPDQAVRLPVPVSVAPGRWGLLWSDPTAPRGWPHHWPADVHHAIWFSESCGSGWMPPRLIARGARITWPSGWTVRRTSEGSKLMMLFVADEFGFVEPGELRIGRVGATLLPVPLGDEWAVIGGSFDVDGDDRIRVLALAMAGPRGLDQFALLYTESVDLGATWTEPKVVAELLGEGYLPQDIRVHLDSFEGLHLLWGDRASSRDPDPGVMHTRIDLRTGAISQIRVPSVPGIELRWVSGVRSDGSLTLIRESFVPRQELEWGLHVSHWDGMTWSVPEPLFADGLAMYVVEGLSDRGEWDIGWSGAREMLRPSAETLARDPQAGFWVLSP